MQNHVTSTVVEPADPCAGAGSPLSGSPAAASGLGPRPPSAPPPAQRLVREMHPDCVWVVCDPLSALVGWILEVDELDGDGHYILKPIADMLLPCVRVRRQVARKFNEQAFLRLFSWWRMSGSALPRTSRRWRRWRRQQPWRREHWLQLWRTVAAKQKADLHRHQEPRPQILTCKDFLNSL